MWGALAEEGLLVISINEKMRGVVIHTHISPYFFEEILPVEVSSALWYEKSDIFPLAEIPSEF